MYYTSNSSKGTYLDQFCEAFGKLVKDKVRSIEYGRLGVITITFKDGTKCGSMVPWFRSGLIDQHSFDEQYCRTKSK